MPRESLFTDDLIKKEVIEPTQPKPIATTADRTSLFAEPVKIAEADTTPSIELDKKSFPEHVYDLGKSVVTKTLETDSKTRLSKFKDVFTKEIPKAITAPFTSKYPKERIQSYVDFKKEGGDVRNEQAWKEYYAKEKKEKLEKTLFESEEGRLPQEDLAEMLSEVNLIEKLPFVKGISHFMDNLKLKETLERVKNGTATVVDEYRLLELKSEMEQDQSFLAKVGEVVTAFPGFAGELGATSAIATSVAAKVGLTTAAAKTAGYGAKIASALKKMVVGGSAQFIPARFFEIMAGTVENMLPEFSFTKNESNELKAMITEEGDNIWLSAAKSLGDQWVEVVSERSGEVLKTVASPVVDPLMGKLTQLSMIKALLKSNPAMTYKGISKIAKQFGWDGILAEMAEEQVGAVMRGLLSEVGLSDEGWVMPTAGDLAVQFVSFGIPGVMIQTANYMAGKNDGSLAETIKGNPEMITGARDIVKASKLGPITIQEDINTVAAMTELLENYQSEFAQPVVNNENVNIELIPYPDGQWGYSTNMKTDNGFQSSITQNPLSESAEEAVSLATADLIQHIELETLTASAETQAQFEAIRADIAELKTQVEVEAQTIAKQEAVDLTDTGAKVAKPKAITKGSMKLPLSKEGKIYASQLKQEISNLQASGITTATQIQALSRKETELAELPFSIGKYTEKVVEKVKEKSAYKKIADKKKEEEKKKKTAKVFAKGKEETKAPKTKAKKVKKPSKLLRKETVSKKPLTDKQIVDYARGRKEIKFRTKTDVKSKLIQQQKDKLTSRFLEIPTIKNLTKSSYSNLYNLSKSDKLGLKKTEREIVQRVLNENYKDQKNIDMEEFRNLVLGNMLPLSSRKSTTYADYGSDNIGLGDTKNTTYILNSEFEHGKTGHFTSDFGFKIDKQNLGVKEFPIAEGSEKMQFAVYRTDVVLTEANIADNVLTVTKTREQAEKWIEDAGTEELVDKDKIGLFAHFRAFDNKEGDIARIAEVQSDVYQRDIGEFGKTGEFKAIQESIKNYKELIEEQSEERIKTKRAIKANDYSLKLIAKFGREELKAMTLDEIDTLISPEVPAELKRIVAYTIDFNSHSQAYSNSVELITKNQKAEKSQLKGFNNDIKVYENSIKEEQVKLEVLKKEELPVTEASFMSYKGIWQERVVREAISIKANEGFEKLRFPTPRTVAAIEGYTVDGDGSRPYDIPGGDYETALNIGDTIEYGGEDMTVVDEDGRGNIYVARSSEVQTIDKDALTDDEVANFWNSFKYDLENLEEKVGKIDTPEKARKVIKQQEIIAKYQVEFRKAEADLSETARKRKRKEILTEAEIKSLPKQTQERLMEIIETGYYLNSLYDEAGDFVEKLAIPREIESYQDFYNEFEDEARDKFTEDFDAGEMLRDSYDEVYEDDGTFYTVNGDTETFLQPYEYQGAVDADEFSIESFDGSQKTVLEFYERQLNKYVKKLRKDNLELITDEEGWEWWETELTKADKAPPTAYRTKKGVPTSRFAKKKLTTQDYIDYVNVRQGTKFRSIFRLKDDLASVGLEISNEQEAEIHKLNREIFGDTNVKLTAQILANKDALGSYSDGMIKILAGTGEEKETYLHEAVHKYLAVFTSKEDYITLLKTAQAKYGSTDIVELEEKIAEGIIEYAKTGEGFTGKLKILVDKFIFNVQKYFDTVDKFDLLYNDILTGEAVSEAPIGLDDTIGPPDEPTVKTKVSGVAKNIEARLIKAGLTEGYRDLATYEGTTFDEQVGLAENLINQDLEEAREVLRGEKPLPYGLKGITLLVGMEEYIKSNIGKDGVAEIASELTNSPLATGTSSAASELSIARLQDSQSPSALVSDIRKVRAKKVVGLETKRAKARKSIKTKEILLKKEDLSWDRFLDGIAC